MCVADHCMCKGNYLRECVCVCNESLTTVFNSLVIWQKPQKIWPEIIIIWPNFCRVMIFKLSRIKREEYRYIGRSTDILLFSKKKKNLTIASEAWQAVFISWRAAPSVAILGQGPAGHRQNVGILAATEIGCLYWCTGPGPHATRSIEGMTIIL